MHEKWSLQWRDSNSQPFSHESSALTTRPRRLAKLFTQHFMNFFINLIFNFLIFNFLALVSPVTVNVGRAGAASMNIVQVNISD